MPRVWLEIWAKHQNPAKVMVQLKRYDEVKSFWGVMLNFGLNVAQVGNRTINIWIGQSGCKFLNVDWMMVG